MNPTEKTQILPARAVARELGISQQALMRLHDRGVIEAVIREPQLVRFDLVAVKKALAASARNNRAPVKSPHMVPTF